jgi:hypothetical protein
MGKTLEDAGAGFEIVGGLDGASSNLPPSEPPQLHRSDSNTKTSVLSDILNIISLHAEQDFNAYLR